jgi:23S rRNA (cytosine1962-C5)-methyltransferase
MLQELLLFQTFREPPDIPADELLPLLQGIVEDETGLRFSGVHWNARQRRQQSKEGVIVPEPPKALLPTDHAACELGIKYLIDVPGAGRDPNLYLDFRAARRWLRNNCEGKEVLNAFSYTCGAGVAALAGGARSVTNLDFSETALGIGQRNAELNGLVAEGAFECLCGDAVPALRMLAGLPVSADRRRGRGGGGRGSSRGRGRGSRGAPDGRGGSRPPLKLRRRQFDVVVLDPPTWTKTKFGAVDLVRDYESLFKPSVLATRPGGTVLATNHVASVDIDEWLEKLEKCAKKADQPLSELTVLEPELDFPSPDGKHPLKIAIAKVQSI